VLINICDEVAQQVEQTQYPPFGKFHQKNPPNFILFGKKINQTDFLIGIRLLAKSTLFYSVYTLQHHIRRGGKEYVWKFQEIFVWDVDFCVAGGNAADTDAGGCGE